MRNPVLHGSARRGWTLLALLCAIPAGADSGSDELSASRELTVNLMVVDGCELGAGTTPMDTVDFGGWPQLDVPIDATATLALQCTPGLTVKVGLDAGENAGAVADRRMSLDGLGVEFVRYQLYTGADFGAVWDDVTGVDLFTDGTVQTLPVFGRIPVQTTPSAGVYRDRVQVTVTF